MTSYILEVMVLATCRRKVFLCHRGEKIARESKIKYALTSIPLKYVGRLGTSHSFLVGILMWAQTALVTITCLILEIDSKVKHTVRLVPRDAASAHPSCDALAAHTGFM